MGPNYPAYDSQPDRGGHLPSMVEVGPPDTRYSSGTAPFWQNAIDQAHGRYLAGTDIAVQDEAAQPSTASNELDYLAELDDIQGNGIFDQPGTPPNVNPNAGMFSQRLPLPGYHAREVPFSMSEVRDVTTGRPIRIVPNGAVAFDSGQQAAFIEQGAFIPPTPLLRAADLSRVNSVSIANVVQNPQPIGTGYPQNGAAATGAISMPTSLAGKLLVAAAVGGGIGALIALATKKKRSE